MVPSASLVIALGDLGLNISLDVYSILQDIEPEGILLTEFWGLRKSDKEIQSDETESTFSFFPIKEKPSSTKTVETRDRKDIFDSFIQESTKIREEFINIIHNLRTHDRLLELGLGDITKLPLDVILVTDFTDPWCTGVFLPVITILQDLLQKEPYAKGHLLISSASFPLEHEYQGNEDQTKYIDEKSKVNQEVVTLFAALQELDIYSDPENPVIRERLAESVGLDSIPPLTFQTYLFDHRKEGTLEVKDREELQLIMGNFLLSLLSGGFAQLLADRVTLDESRVNKGFYSGAAAAILIFNPEPLIKASASKLGAEFISIEMLGDVLPDSNQTVELSKRIISSVGDLISWYEQLVNNTQLEVWGDSPKLQLGLHFADLHFEGVIEEEWADRIRNYDNLFIEENFADLEEKISDNSSALVEHVQSQLNEALISLPQNPDAYPGGIQRTKIILEGLIGQIDERERILSENGPIITTEEAIDADLGKLDLASRSLPKIPRLISRIIPLVSRFINLEPLMRWWRYRNTQIVQLREHCVRNSERKFSNLLDLTARNRLQELCGLERSLIHEFFEKIEKLEHTLTNIQAQLEEVWNSYEPLDSFFRISAIDMSYLNWVFQEWKPPWEKTRSALLSDYQLLDGWQGTNKNTLKTIFMSFGEHVFSPVRELHIEDVLRQREDVSAEAVLPNLLQGSTLLMRPDFDPLGGGGYAPKLRYVLLDQPGKTDFDSILKEQPTEWEIIPTGNPRFVSCCMVRQYIPLPALKIITQPGRRIYEDMDTNQRLGVFLAGEWVKL